MVVKETMDIKKKSSTFHKDNRKDALRASQELGGPDHCRIRGVKV
jgi:hypothetical protein